MILTNSRLESMFGYAPGGLLGKSVDILIPEKLHRRHRNLREAFLRSLHARSRGTANIDTRGIREDQSVFPINISLSHLPVVGDRGFAVAEATAGGVPLAEVRLDSMESRVCPGLHLAGEVLDVDGRIGGFNFQWAWASGFVAGSSAAGAPATG